MALSKILPASRDQSVDAANLILNGEMTVAQRGTSATGLTTSGYRTVDRHYIQITSAGTWTSSQSTDAPTDEGFSKSLKFECTTANASLGTASSLRFQHTLEGQDLQQLSYGTSNAKSITVSFWVKSNKTGTYVLDLQNLDNSRVSCGTYTISSANTWEKKTITLAGDTSQGFDDDNNASLRMIWWLAAGSNFTTGTQATVWEAQDNTNRAVALTVNLADTIGNTFYITGVCLNVGDQAPANYPHRSYGEELALCQRYYQKRLSRTGIYTPYSSNDNYNVYWDVYPVSMRAAPSTTIDSGWTVTNNETDSITAYYSPATNVTLPGYTLDAEL